jgi:hypothetical protein
MTTAIKYDIFPQICQFDAFFTEKNIELRQRTKKLKIQLKLCPGVEPPQIKRVQVEEYTIEKKPYTEWNTFSEDDTIEIEKQPSCTMVPLIHRLLSLTTESKKAVVSYFAPVGWEVTRVNAFVTDGFFKRTEITRSVCRENKAMVEVEVFYPRVTRENVWCSVRLEGVISRKRILDIRVPHVKEIFVVSDENGEHVLPDGVINAEDLE